MQNTFVPGLIDLAVQRGVLIGGDDFKSGQTKLKSVLVDFLVGAGLKPTSIVSYNHLGNNDGMNLSAPQTFRRCPFFLLRHVPAFCPPSGDMRPSIALLNKVFFPPFFDKVFSDLFPPIFRQFFVRILGQSKPTPQRMAIASAAVPG